MSEPAPGESREPLRPAWSCVLWPVLAPGLGHLRADRYGQAFAVCALLWGLLLLLVGRSAHWLDRPGLIVGLGALLVLLWLASVVHAARLLREVEPTWHGWQIDLAFVVLQAFLLPALAGQIPTVPDLIEIHPTDQNAVSGAGGLTAGVSRSGVLTLLRWPGPAGRDHLHWRAVPGKPEGHGLRTGMGVFAGVVLGEQVHWFKDAAFETTQRYASDRDDAVVTEHVGLGLRAVETLVVDPERDLLLWTVELRREAGGPRQASLVWFENLAPCTEKLDYLAISDWALDDDNDFVGALDDEGALIRFRPRTPASARPPTVVADWVDGIDERFGPGVAFALGIDAEEAQAWLGEDTGQDDLPSALARGIGASAFASPRASGVLRTELNLSDGAASATLRLAAGPTVDGPRGARTVLREARGEDPAAQIARARAAQAAWLARARLPETDDENVLRLARRSLLALRNACDRPSGAMVASVAAQLPYALDWTRDGAFLNLALDEAGYPGLVTRHNDYYLGIQRTDGLFAGTYPMNTYEDGAPGGPIFLEVDNAALAVWTLADHARFLSGDEQARYRERTWPAIERGAEFLVRWRDPFTGLLFWAHEDDNPVPRRGIQGAVSAVLALRAAADAARVRGEQAAADRWTARAEELRAAIFDELWDADQGRLVDGGPKELDASAWALWPCAVFDPDDPRAAEQGEYLWAELQRTLKGEKERSGYDAKLYLALAALWGPEHPRRPALVAAYRELAAKLPTPDTGLLGEHCRIERGADGEVRLVNLNDMPHVWEHALHYLTALRLFPPKR